ncbi:hypothetical protein Daus18300_004392 [Diaporthe australafricana]|uniref:Uncharacterized protein n=1 Tax=Diaporthe australafricana TaxID=127596 RepID=A0ABR3X8X5_9PEZI
MERTQSRRGEPSPGSKDYAEMVAESNRRLDELSPHSPEDKAPDTPMPTPAILATDNDEQPPQLPPLPPAEFDDPSDGQVAPLAGNSPNEKSTTTLRAKRSASEISGDDPGGPSRNQEHVLQSPAQSKTVATTTVDGHKRCISEKELRAMCLQPPLPIQKELYKVYSVLVQIVQAAADDFSVVDPHDFIEALSWSESREAGDVEIIRRLRTQTLIAGGICKKLVVPFSHDADIFLVVVNLTTRTFRILDPRTREQLQSKEKIDNRDLYMCVWLFMRTLFPRECPPMSLWSMSLGFTVPLSTPINEPGIVSGNYLNDFGVRLDLPTVLPFFYEVLRIVAGVEAQVAYSDVMLLKRLFAAFEESPIAERTRVLNDLREGSDKNLHYILDDQMRTVLREKNFVFRKAVAGTNPSLGGSVFAQL